MLRFTFDNGKATDTSGNKNHGKVKGKTVVDGKVDRALKFSGYLPGQPKSDVQFTWTADVPILVRGLVAADDHLVIAGPEDIVQEPKAMRSAADPKVQKRLQQQAAAMTGARGGLLKVVTKADGKIVHELELDTIPVWDGLAAADGRLYFSGKDGTIRCYGR